MNKEAIAKTQTQYVHMATDKLLEVLKENRANHEQDWERAHAAWKKAQLGKIERYMDALREAVSVAKQEGKMVFPHANRFELDEPRSYVKSYDREIRRFELTIDKEMYLTHEEFNKYVMDEWSWKNRFSATNSVYTGAAF
jgi:hypothetical protein